MTILVQYSEVYGTCIYAFVVLLIINHSIRYYWFIVLVVFYSPTHPCLSINIILFLLLIRKSNVVASDAVLIGRSFT